MATINPDMVNAITELAIQADKARGVYNPDDLEENKQKAIALYKRRINAAIVLFDEGRIDYEGYRKRIEKYEREMALWQLRTTETEKVAFELALCADAINEIHLLWDTAEPETKQRLARSLFEYLVYDLDTRQIVAHKFKPTIDRFVRLRTALQDDVVEVIGKEKFPDLEDQGNDIPPRGFEPLF